MIAMQQISYVIKHLAPGSIHQIKIMLNHRFEGCKTSSKMLSMDEEQENAFLKVVNMS